MTERQSPSGVKCSHCDNSILACLSNTKRWSEIRGTIAEKVAQNDLQGVSTAERLVHANKVASETFDFLVGGGLPIFYSLFENVSITGVRVGVESPEDTYTFNTEFSTTWGKGGPRYKGQAGSVSILGSYKDQDGKYWDMYLGHQNPLPPTLILRDSDDPAGYNTFNPTYAVCVKDDPEYDKYREAYRRASCFGYVLPILKEVETKESLKP